MTDIDLSTLWPHQLETYNFALHRKEVFDFSAAGCVSYDTEFLTPVGWKRISEYEDGDIVGQINPTTLQLTFKKPLDYVKKQCSRMYHINPMRGMSMMLSSEHRVLYYMRKDLASWRVCSAAEYVEKYYDKYIAATFLPDTSCFGLELSDEQLRVMVAVIADGYFSSHGNTCVIRIKKERKKQRLSNLLRAAGISYKRREAPDFGSAAGFSIFSFTAPFRDKIYDEKYWGCSGEQLSIIADEVLYWDGDQKSRFFTSQKQSADFIQYVFTASGYPTSLSVCERIREDRKDSTEFVVIKRRTKSPFVGRIRQESITQVRPKVGFKYCFTTETSFWLARHNGYIFVTGNTGKTISHAKVAEHFLLNEQGSRVVVICPKTLMRSAWKNEFSQWLPHISFALAEAPEINRKAAFESGAQVVCINIDGVSFLAQQSAKWIDKYIGKNAMLIIDESSYLKNPDALRTKAAMKIAPYFTRRHLLSATPAPNTVTELWSQTKILDLGKRLGKRYTAFRNLMQAPEQHGPFTQWVDKAGAPDIAYGLLADCTIRHEFDKVMPHVPDMEHNIVWYDLPNKQLSFYAQMEEEAFVQHEGREINAVNAGVLANKLLQIASGAVYAPDESGNRSWVMVDSGRYDLIADLIEARLHTIVFFIWDHQKVELEVALKKRRLSYTSIDGSVKRADVREKIVQDYEAGKYRCLLLHPKTGAHGLTLIKGTTVIFASPVYNADWYQQGTARIRRGMQRNATESIIVLAKGTRDMDAYETFVGKKARMESLNNLFSFRPSS